MEFDPEEQPGYEDLIGNGAFQKRGFASSPLTGGGRSLSWVLLAVLSHWPQGPGPGPVGPATHNL